MKLLVILVPLYFFIPFHLILAQDVLLSLSHEEINCDQGGNVIVEFQVDNWEDVGGVSGTIEWNELELSFVDLEEFFPSGGTFLADTSTVSSGYLTFNWFNSEGTDLPDGSVVMEIDFEVVNDQIPAVHPVDFSDNPTEMEVVKIDQNFNVTAAPFTIDNGSVTVLDVDPELECLTDIMLELDENGVGELNVSDFIISTSYACGTLDTMASQTMFTCADLGIQTVTITAEGSNGSTSSCQVDVEVFTDDHPELECIASTTYGLDSNGEFTLDPNELVTSVSAVCGTVDVSANQTFFTCADLGLNTVTVTAEADNGNTSTCQVEVTLEDNNNPVLSCVSVYTLALDSQGEGVLDVNEMVSSAEAACGNVDLSLSQTNFNCADIGTSLVTVTGESDNGNTSTCQVEVTVEFNESPDLVCESELTIELDENGEGTLDPNDAVISVTLACGTVDTTASQTLFTCADLGIQTVTITAEGSNGSTSTCQVEVEVTSDAQPDLECIAATSYDLDSNGEFTLDPNELVTSVSISCGTVDVSANQTFFTCADLGLNTVTVTAEASNGNTSTCQVEVTIEDNNIPVLSCVSVYTLALDSQGEGVLNVNELVNSAEAACGTVDLSLSQTNFNCADIGTSTVTVTGESDNGNTSTCQVEVTLEFNEAPDLICESELTIELDENGEGTLDPNDAVISVTLACGTVDTTASQTLFTCVDLGVQTVTITAEGSNGQSSTCQVEVEVFTDDHPELECIASTTYGLNINGEFTLDPNDLVTSVSAVCGTVDVIANQTFFTCADLGLNTITVTAEGDNGNTSSCQVEVTLEDNNIPVLSCVSVYTLALDSQGEGVLNVNELVNSAEAACGTVDLSLSQMNFNCADIGTSTVTVTGESDNGNTSTCQVEVTVEFNEAPDLICESELTIELDENGEGTLDPNDAVISVTLACGTVDITANQTAFTCADIGIQTVTITAEGSNGQSSTCQVEVVVFTDDNPELECIVNTTYDLDGNGEFTLDPNDLVTSVSAVCGTVEVSANQTLFTCVDLGLNTITVTAEGDNGNTSTCQVEVAIEDNHSPDLECVNNYTLELDGNGEAILDVNLLVVTAEAVCEGVDLSLSQTNFNCADIGTSTVTVTGESDNGNTNNCQVEVTVEFNESPELICESELTIELDENGEGTLDPNDAVSSVTLACGMVDITANQTAFTCADIGLQTVTITAEGSNGQSSTCQVEVEVFTDDDPELECVATATYDLDGNGEFTLDPNELITSVSAVCGTVDITANQTFFTCVDLGLNTITVTAEGDNGNTSTCLVEVAIEDNHSPDLECVNNYTLELDENGETILDVNLLVVTAEAVCGGVDLSLSQTNFNCADIGTTTVTVTGESNNGNTSTCQVEVTVEFNESPDLICESELTIELDENGEGTLDPSDAVSSVTLACGTVDITANQTEFTCADIGIQTVTITAEGSNGQSSTCQVEVEVFTDEDPELECVATATYDLDGNGEFTLDPNELVTSMSAVCGTVDVSANQTFFTCVDLGLNTITVTAEGDNGNTSTCQVEVAIEDNHSPDLECVNNYTLELDGSGEAVLDANLLVVTAEAVCGGVDLSLSQTNFNCADIGTSTVTVTGESDNGNTSTCQVEVTVEFNEAPDLVCESELTIELDENGEGVLDPNDAVSSVTLACGTVNITANQTEFSCADIGIQTVTITAEGSNGQSGTCQVEVEVFTDDNPELECIVNTTYDLDGNGEFTLDPNDLVTSVSAVCGTVDLSANQTFFTCADLGLNTITVTAEGDNGNTSTCLVEVTIEDNHSPHLECVNNYTLELDENGEAVLDANELVLTAEAVCGGVDLSLSQTNFNCADIGTATVTVTGESDNGNTSTCQVEVTVEFNEAPNLMCENELTLELDENGEGTLDPNDAVSSVTLACGTVDITADQTEFSCADIGIQIVTITAEGSNGQSGTCQVEVEVFTDDDPELECIASTTYDLDENGELTLDPNELVTSVSISCGSVEVNANQTEFSCADVGPNTVTVTAEGDNGNTSTCQVEVTIEDNHSPDLECVNNYTLELDENGEALLDANELVLTAEAVCGGVDLSLSQTNFDCADIGTTTVTVTGESNNSNTSTCQVEVTVEFNESPDLICESELTLELDENGEGTLDPNDAVSSVTLACGTVDITANQTEFTCADIGLQTVTITAEGSNGQSSTCQVEVEVFTDDDPELECIASTTYDLDENGEFTLDPNELVTSVSISCGSVEVNANQTEFSCADVGPNTVTVTAEGDNGNTSTCQVEVTIEDNHSPDLECVNNYILELDENGEAVLDANELVLTAEAVCGGVDLSLSKTNFNCTDIGTSTVTVTGESDNGNTSTCQVEVTVEFNESPDLICESELTLELDENGEGVLDPNSAVSSVTLACGTVDITASQTEFTCADIGIQTVTITAEGSNGQSSTCQVEVEVFTDDDPELECIASTTYDLDENGEFTLDPTELVTSVSIACGSVEVSANQTEFSCADVGPNTVTVTAEGDNGNTSTCQVEVTIEDNHSPDLECVNNYTLELDENGEAVLDANELVVTAEAVCGGVDLSLSQTNFDCADIGILTVTVTGESNNGNTSTCQVEVTVEFNEAPNLICESELTLELDENGEAVLDPNDAVSSVTLACGTVDITADQTEFSCADIGIQTVTITAEGSNGQSSTCQVEVEVTSDAQPELECVASATYDLDANGEFTLDPNELVTSVNISCGTVDVSANQTEFTCEDLGINIVTVTAEGNNGNTNTCQVEVTIEDYNSPVLECVNNYTIELDEDGEAVLDANDLVTAAEAVCGEVELNLSHTNFDCGDIGNVIVIIGAEAENNQVSTCEVIVSVENNNPPVIMCEEELVIELEEGETKVLEPDDFITHVEVVCGDFEIFVSQSEFNCSDFGMNTVTIEVTGSNGLVSTCSVLVNVLYSEEFEIQCFETGTLELGHNGEVSLNPMDLISSLPESCGEIKVEASQSEFTCADLGDNSITITAANDFGQVSECMVSIVVVDSIPPEINCRDLVVNLEEGGVFNLDISTAITDISDNCDSLSLVTDSLLQLDCSHVGVNSVEIIISDQSGNLDTCTTGLTVTDTMDFCDNLIIEGALVTEFGQPVGRAEVHLLKESNIFKEFEVQQDGEYRFEELVSGSDYLLIPEKDINPLNGVSTFDALLIQAHILGIRVLDSPYKLIAADVRPDGKIDVLDILDVRNLILGRRSRFPANNSWKFIFSEQDFQPGMVHPPPPSQLETNREYMDLSSSVYNADFIGVKIGDVNNSVHPTSLVHAEERDLGQAYSLEVENTKFEEDDLVKVEFKAADFRQLLGFQYTFHFDLSSLEFVDFESGILPELSENNFGFQLLEEGIITQSWNSLSDFYPGEEEILFTLVFKAKKKGQLNESVYLSNRITRAEAYSNLFEVLGIELVFASEIMESQQVLHLHRNAPNPFSQSTHIEFSLSQKDDVELVVIDLSGQKLKVVSGSFERGYHRIEINRSDLHSAGMYFYQIKCGSEVETGKMSFIPKD